MQRRSILTHKGVDFAKTPGRNKNVGIYDFIKQSSKLRIGQRNPIQRLKLFTEIIFKRSAIMYVRPVSIFQVCQLSNETIFYFNFFHAAFLFQKYKIFLK
jgi:hypothetical protein